MKLTAPVLVVMGSIAVAGCSSGGYSTVTPPPNVVQQEQAPATSDSSSSEQTVAEQTPATSYSGSSEQTVAEQTPAEQTPTEQTPTEQTPETVSQPAAISLTTEYALWERWDRLALGETLDIPAVSRQTSYTVENGQVVFGEVSAAETGALFSYTKGLDPIIDPVDFVITSATGTKVVFEENDDPQNSTFRTVDVPFETEYDRDPGFEFGNSPYSFEFTEDTSGVRNIVFGSNDEPRWNYQTYGVWMTGFGGSSGTIGAASGGATTPVASIPNTGTATFTGISSGLFLDNAGEAFLAQSTMQADALFTNRTVGFTTSNTHITPLASSVNAMIADDSVAQPFTATPGLNLSGTMSYAVGENKLSGPVSSTNGMTGVVDANFYGPVANEIGGSFAVKGTAGNYIGAFGGKP